MLHLFLKFHIMYQKDKIAKSTDKSDKEGSMAFGYMIYMRLFITCLTCELPELVVKKDSFFHIQIFERKMKFQ